MRNPAYTHVSTKDHGQFVIAHATGNTAAWAADALFLNLDECDFQLHINRDCFYALPGAPTTLDIAAHIEANWDEFKKLASATLQCTSQQ